MEPSANKDENEPPPNWPTEGSIVIQNLTVRYKPDMDPAIVDLSVAIQGGHKVGIVGRTGAFQTRCII